MKKTLYKKKRKKKTGYLTGVHKSKKCTTDIKFRSGWEEVVCHYLDENPDVVSYWYETIRIPYLSPVRKKPRIYIPDFLILYKSGSVKMVEVKRKNQLDNIWVQAKAIAAKNWCQNQNPKIEYEFWSEEIIFPLKKLYQTKGILSGKSKRKPKSKSKSKSKRKTKNSS